MSEIDFFTQLPIFPQDDLSRGIWFEQMKVLLNNLDARVNASVIEVVTLEQTTVPSQGDWETAYTTQTGNSLPIPASAKLYWWDTTNNRFGGVFGTLTNDDTVYPRSSANSKGATAILESHLMNNAHTVDYALGENITNFPVVEFIANVRFKLRIIFSIMTVLSSGSGSWGSDVLINGVKAGTLYYALASNRGIVERTTSGQVNVQIETPTLEPGPYEVQAIFGRTNSTTPTLTIGNSARVLLVRGVTQ